MAKVQIEGTRPLLWHRFAPEMLQAEAGARIEKKGAKGNDPSEWARSVLATRDGQLYVEPSYVFGCLRDAGRYTKSGRGSLQRVIAATVQVVGDRLLVDRFLPQEGPPPQDPAAPVYLDVRMVRNPATGGRNVRYRIAASAGWSLEFQLAWDASLISREQLHAVLIDGGNLVGLGDGRNIGFGRFAVRMFAPVAASAAPAKARPRRRA